MDPSPSALLALGILGFVPGFLLYRVFRPVGSTLECVAIAPALSFGFVCVLGEVAALVGVPFGPLAFLVALAATAAGAAIRWSRRADRRPGPERTPCRPAGALVAAGIVLAAGIWVLGAGGL